MSDKQLTDDILALLSRTPDAVRALLGGLPPHLLHADEGEDTFSPFSVLGHLVQGELNDWTPRMRWILEHGREQPFPPFDRFAHVERTKGRSLESLLAEFETLREMGVGKLRDAIGGGADLDAGDFTRNWEKSRYASCSPPGRYTT